MFLCFGSQKPESSDHSRQNYNYMVTSWNCCLHYNSGNRFPDFPIGLNWGRICRNWQQHYHAATCRCANVSALQVACVDGKAQFSGRLLISPDLTREAGVSRPAMDVRAARFSSGAE